MSHMGHKNISSMSATAFLGFYYYEEDTMTRATFIKKKKQLIGDGLQFRGLVHCHHGRKHGGMRTYMVLER